MTDAVVKFITRWQAKDGSERANYQLFLTELCELLGLDKPDPSGADTAENAYVFERRVTFRHGDGGESRGFIDLYRRGCFVCEAKQTGKALGSGQWDDAMLRARGQAEQYARALPAEQAEAEEELLMRLVVLNAERAAEEVARHRALAAPRVPGQRNHRAPRWRKGRRNGTSITGAGGRRGCWKADRRLERWASKTQPNLHLLCR